MAQHSKLGKKGEELARNYLMSVGYTILEQNWRCKNREIDIIALKDNVIVIIEVKTRSTEYFGAPEESVTLAKQKLLIDAAGCYLQSLKVNTEVRFDIIAIIAGEGAPNIKHIKEAFIPQIDSYE